MEEKKSKLGNKTREMQANVVGMLEMPPDIMMNLPKFTLIGNQELFIENHLGILEYDKQLIRIKSNLGQIIIKGEELRLRELKAAEMAIEGKISAFILED